MADRWMNSGGWTPIGCTPEHWWGRVPRPQVWLRGFQEGRNCEKHAGIKFNTNWVSFAGKVLLGDGEGSLLGARNVLLLIVDN